MSGFIKVATSVITTQKYITFEDFVEYGLNVSEGLNIHDGFCWSFDFEGHPITHADNESYIVPTKTGDVLFTTKDILFIRDDEIYPCPIDVFEEKYKVGGDLKTTNLTFGEAIFQLKRGMKVARSGWNGKNMFIAYMPPLYLPPYNTGDTSRKVNDRTAKWIGEDKPLDCQPYLAMYNAQEQWIPGWLASQSDMLGEDWYIVQ